MYSIKLHVLVISATLMVCFCAPLSKESGDKILDYYYTNDGKGGYSFRFETSNGIKREETGTLVDAGLPNEHMSVQGTFSYINPEGEYVYVNYTADENGNTILTQEPIYLYKSVPDSLLG